MADITRRRILQSGGAAGLLLLPGGRRARRPTGTARRRSPAPRSGSCAGSSSSRRSSTASSPTPRNSAEQTGVKVRVEAESWDDIRPKSAVAANVGAGPDIIMGTLDDPFKFPKS